MANIESIECRDEKLDTNLKLMWVKDHPTNKKTHSSTLLSENNRYRQYTDTLYNLLLILPGYALILLICGRSSMRP